MSQIQPTGNVGKPLYQSRNTSFLLDHKIKIQ